METNNANSLYLSNDNLNLVIKETKQNLFKNSIYGLFAGIAIYSLTKRKLPSLFGFSYFIGKSFGESNNLLKSKLQRRKGN